MSAWNFSYGTVEELLAVKTRNFILCRLPWKAFAVIIITGLPVAGGNTVTLGKTASLDYEGEVGFDHLWFPRNQKDKPDNISEFFGGVHLGLRINEAVAFHYAPRIFLDFDDENRSQNLFWDNVFFDLIGKHFELRAGYQTFEWQVTKSGNPADFINQKDYQVDLLKPPKLGELAMRGRIKISAVNKNFIDFIVLPLFTPASLPLQTNRFDLFSDTQGIVMSNAKARQQYQTSSLFDDKSLKRWRPQAAVRYTISPKSGQHLSLFYFNGYDRYPGLLRVTETNHIIQQYRPVHKSGGAFKLMLGTVQLKGEGVYTAFENKSIPSYHLMEREEFENLSPYVSGIFGGDFIFSLSNTIPHKAILTLEGLLDSDMNKEFVEIEGFRPYRSHIFTGFTFISQNEAARTLRAGVYFNFLRPGAVYAIHYSEQLFHNVPVHIGFKGLQLHKKSDLKPIDRSARFEAGIARSF